MRRLSVFVAAALALCGLGAAAQAAPAPRTSTARDWSRTVAATPEGGFRMGNPAARVKLVEYGSLTCPTCAHFARTGAMPLIARYVRTGKVSYEFRNMVLNGIDVTATLLARCAGARGFFAMTDALYATQPQWVGRISGLSEAQKSALKGLPEGRRLGRIADLGGLTRIAARFGVTPARGKQCLADKAGLDRLGAMYEAAAGLGVEGTPTFFVNGVKVDGVTWTEVEPALRSAGA